MVTIKRFDICLINLNPTVGSEMKKTRPCLVISPDSMNDSRLKTVIVAPLTTVIRNHFPTRLLIMFKGKQGQVALEQLRVVDRSRIIKNLGAVELKIQKKVLSLLQEMFG